MSNVLIVDDALFVRQLIREALEQVGFDIAGEAKDGKEGDYIDYVKGANIGGFVKVADSMLAQGLV